MPPRREDQGRITPVGRERTGAEELPRVRQERLPERAAPDASRQPAPRETEQRTDQFRESGRLERFIRAIGERIEHGWLYQTFRLPGSSRVIHDRRSAVEEERSAPHETAVKEEVRATYKNYLAERMPGLPQMPAETKPPQERPLSAFEETLVKRFEEAAEQAKSAPDGKPHFLQKTATQWKEFFMKFLHRTEKKQVPLDAVGDELTFRGLLKKGSDPSKGVVVGDFKLADGTMEKFARFDVLLQAVLSNMGKLLPGATVAKQTIAPGIAGETLEYITIGPPVGEAMFATSAQNAQGVFTNLKTETEIARQLGLRGPDVGGAAASTAGTEERVARQRGRGGWGKFFGDQDETADDVPGRFIPWWHWDREARTGQRRWFTAVTIALLVTLVSVGFWVLLRIL